MIRIALVATVAGACAAAPPRPLVAEVQRGPATGARPNRVLVLRASCGSVEYHCPADFAHTVDGIVRGGLEFAGYNVVDSESLRLETRQRHEEQHSTTTTTENHNTTHYHRDILPIGSRIDSDGKTTTETDQRRHDPRRFRVRGSHGRSEARGPRTRRSDAIVSVRIVIGGTTGMWRPNQNVEVMSQARRRRGRCDVMGDPLLGELERLPTVTAALENAARCTIHAHLARAARDAELGAPIGNLPALRERFGVAGGDQRGAFVTADRFAEPRGRNGV